MEYIMESFTVFTIYLRYKFAARYKNVLYNHYFRDEGVDVLCIADWNGVISFYTIGGESVRRERLLSFIPLKIVHFPEGQYFLVCGSNKQCLLMTYDGIQLVSVGNTFSSWVWSCAVHPTGSHVVSIVLH